MRIKPHDWFFYGLCSGLGLVAGLVLLLSLMGAAPRAYAQDRCAGIDVIASAVAVQGHEVSVVRDTEQVSRILAFLKRHGFPEEFTADGLFFVKLEDGMRVSFINDGCLDGMVSVDVPVARRIQQIVNGEPKGRDA